MSSQNILKNISYKDVANGLYNVCPIELNKLVMPFVMDEDGEEYLDLDHIDVMMWMEEYLDRAYGSDKFDVLCHRFVPESNKFMFKLILMNDYYSAIDEYEAESMGHALAISILIIDERSRV
jgi:hypothetical protein